MYASSQKQQKIEEILIEKYDLCDALNGQGLLFPSDTGWCFR